MKKFTQFIEDRKDRELAENLVILDIDVDALCEGIVTFHKHIKLNELQNLKNQAATDEPQSRMGRFGSWLQNNVNPFNVDVQNKWRNMGHTLKGAGAAAMNPWSNMSTSRTAAMAMQQAQQTGRVNNTIKQVDNLKKTLRSQLGMDDQQITQVLGGVDRFLQRTLSNVNKHLSGEQEPMAGPNGGQGFHANAAQHYAGKDAIPPMAQQAPPQAQFAPQQGGQVSAPVGGQTMSTSAPMGGQTMSTQVPNPRKQYKPQQVTRPPTRGNNSNVSYMGY